MAPQYPHTELVIGKGGNDPRLEGDASAQILRGNICIGNPGICQLIFVEDLRSDFLTPFVYSIQIDSTLA